MDEESWPAEEFISQLRNALGLGPDFEGGWSELLEVVRNDYKQLREVRKALEL